MTEAAAVPAAPAAETAPAAPGASAAAAAAQTADAKPIRPIRTMPGVSRGPRQFNPDAIDAVKAKKQAIAQRGEGGQFARRGEGAGGRHAATPVEVHPQKAPAPASPRAASAPTLALRPAAAGPGQGAASATTGAPPQADAAADDGTRATVPAAATSTFAPVTVDGETYSSQQALEQALRSGRGQQRRANEASIAAHSWKQRAEALERDLTAARNGGGGTGSGASPAASLAGAGNGHGAAPAAAGTAPASAGATVASLSEPFNVDTIDWGFHDKLLQSDGPTVATAYAVREAIGQFAKQVEQYVAHKLSPVQPMIQQREIVAGAVRTFESAARRVTPEGQAVYPELHDAQARPAVAQLWSQIIKDVPKEMHGSEFLVQHAIMAYRLLKFMHAPAQTAAGAATPQLTPGASAVPPAPAAASLARRAPETLDPTGAPPQRTRRTGADSSSDIKARTRNAGPAVHPTLRVRR